LKLSIRSDLKPGHQRHWGPFSAKPANQLAGDAGERFHCVASIPQLARGFPDIPLDSLSS
jgi:hypothetical protein